MTGYLTHEVTVIPCLNTKTRSKPTGIDILACPGCGGRLRFLATIEDPKTVGKILNHLGIPNELPEPAAARSPPWEELTLPGFGDWLQS